MIYEKDEWVECTKDELFAFLNKYPRELDVDITGIFDPPLKTYNDFTVDPKWPGSAVAKVSLGSCREGEKDEYYIKKGLK